MVQSAGLQVVSEKLLELPPKYLKEEWRVYLTEFQDRIPPINFREIDGKKVIAPAKSWERINNTEVPQLYPVFPWGIYGLGKPGLEIALNTFNLDPDAACQSVLTDGFQAENHDSATFAPK